jgi:ABC-type spermidine/putrescine transport system permease subunit II
MTRKRSVQRTAIVVSAVVAVSLSLYVPVATLGGALGASWEAVGLLTLNSLLLAAVSGAVATLLGAIAALFVWECMSERPRRALTNIIYITTGIPSIVTALVVLWLFGDTMQIAHVVIAMVLATAPYAARYMLGDLDALSPYTLLTLHALGAGGLSTIWHGILPSARRPVLATFLYTTARAFVEVPILCVLFGDTPTFLPMQIVLQPLSPAAFSAALVLVVCAMILYDRARALHRGQ